MPCLYLQPLDPDARPCTDAQLARLLGQLRAANNDYHRQLLQVGHAARVARGMQGQETAGSCSTSCCSGSGRLQEQQGSGRAVCAQAMLLPGVALIVLLLRLVLRLST